MAEVTITAAEAIGRGDGAQVGGLAVWAWDGGYWTLDPDGFARRLNPTAEQVCAAYADRLAWRHPR